MATRSFEIFSVIFLLNNNACKYLSVLLLLFVCTEAITDVDLSRCELSVFHVGTLRNLRRLVLSHNRIASVVSLYDVLNLFLC